jgi:hypothetical protein
VGIIDEDPDANGLISFSAANHITELYLSVGSNVLFDTSLPNFVAHLKNSGLRVEALTDCRGPSQCQMGTWRTRIEQVKDYNEGHAANERFDGVHLDLEPWVGTCPPPPKPCDFSWVPDLISYYQDASFALEGSGLAVAADISGVKVISDNVDPADRQALLDAATRLVLMEFGVSVDVINARVNAFRNSVDLSGAFFMIATRVKDFAISNGCQNGPVLNQFDVEYAEGLGYAGWATLKYSDYNDPSICPGACCAIGP